MKKSKIDHVTNTKGGNEKNPIVYNASLRALIKQAANMEELIIQ